MRQRMKIEITFAYWKIVVDRKTRGDVLSEI